MSRQDKIDVVFSILFYLVVFFLFVFPFVARFYGLF